MRFLWIIIAAAMATRAWILFGTPYVPGINGAYYLVQARSLLEHGTLGIPDLPLAFHLHAALAWLLAKIGHMAMPSAIVLAVKLCDSVVPPLAAWPVFLVVRRWARLRGLGDAIPLASAALACFAGPLLSMIGEFEKNSIALVWLAAFITALHAWLETPTRKGGLLTLTWMVLLGLTHVGVLGAAIVIGVAVGAIYVWRGDRSQRLTLLPWAGAGLLLLLLAGGLVFWKFDPHRIERLITALTDPARFSSDGLQMPTPRGGLGLMFALIFPIFFACAVVPAIILAWKKRGQISVADFSIVVGCGVTVLALTGPWFNMDKAMRLGLIAVLPAIFVGAFGVLQIKTAWRRWAVTGLFALLLIGGAVPVVLRGGTAIFNDACLRELQGLAPIIADPDRTLISAQHGAEWWTAWFLHTHIAQAPALKAEDWQKYDAVYFLELKWAAAMPKMGGFGPGIKHPPGFGPPPGGIPGGHGPPANTLNPMMSARIPTDAEIVHNGPCLRLARVSHLPENLASPLPPAAP